MPDPTPVDLATRIRNKFETERKPKFIALAFFTPITLWLLLWLLMVGLKMLTEFHNMPAGLFSFGFTIAIYAYLFQYFLSVAVPEVTGVVTTDVITGRMRAYPPGLHLRWPTEQKKYENFINLRDSKTDGVTENYPSGTAMLEAKFSVHYVTTWDRLPRHISVAESIINDGLLERASAKLRSLIDALQLSASTDQAQVAQEKQNLREKREAFGRETLEYFGKPEAYVRMADPEEPNKEISVKLDDYYGIRITSVPVSDLDYEASYQKMLTAKQQAVTLAEVADSIKGTDNSVSDKDARDMAFMLSGDRVKKDIKQETIIHDASPRVIDALKEILPVVAAALRGGKS